MLGSEKTTNPPLRSPTMIVNQKLFVFNNYSLPPPRAIMPDYERLHKYLTVKPYLSICLSVYQPVGWFSKAEQFLLHRNK